MTDALSALEAAACRAVLALDDVLSMVPDDFEDAGMAQLVRARAHAAKVILDAWVNVRGGTGASGAAGVVPLEEQRRRAALMLAEPPEELRNALESAGWKRTGWKRT